MSVIKTLVGLLVLMAPLAVAQDMRWQSMNGPYYVHDVTGISLGLDGAQMRAYMVASDLTDKYIYTYTGTSPINGWTKPLSPLAGVKHVSASRQNGWMAYATVPDGAGDFPGVHYTTNGGQDWLYNINSQPGNKVFTCIETHPTNPQICFTGATYDAPQKTLWITSDRGIEWKSLEIANQFEPAEHINSVCVDPAAGNTIQETPIYVCYKYQGIWKNSGGGLDPEAWQGLSLLDHGTTYTGIDVAVKEGNSDCIFLLAEISGEYAVWHSDDGGIYWEGSNGDPGPFYNFGTDPVSKVIVQEYLENEVVWVISPNTIYIGVKFPDNHIEWATASGSYQCIASDIGAPSPAGVVYAGLRNGIKQISGNWGTHFDYFGDIDVSKGANISNIVSLDCMIGAPLYALGEDGGYVFYNHQIVQPGDDDDWKTISWLQGSQSDPNNGEVIGDRISLSYMDYGIVFTASAHDDSDAYLLEDGQAVHVGSETPSRIRAIAGPLLPNEYHTRPFVAGKNKSAENVVYQIVRTAGGYDVLQICDNFGSNPPIAKDMIRDRTGVYSEYYICGERTSNQANIVEYVDTWGDPHRYTLLNDGLADVLKGNAMIKSPEIYRNSVDYYPVMYLGTEKGVFKTSFENSIVIPWRNISVGIGQGIEIIDLANFGQGFEYTSYKPDSLVEYALGKNVSGTPYLYISADSGRSWIENGGYLRDQGLIASSITTISDIRTNFNNPYYLAVGTNRGIHVLPYNVKSGTLAQNDTWGPGLVIVNGDVTIPEDDTLNIAAGTTIKFTYGFDRLASGNDVNKSEILVYGTLNLDGEAENRITVTSSSSTPQPGDWGGIYFYHNTTGTLSNVDILYPVTGITLQDSASVSFSHGSIKHCQDDGIYNNQGFLTAIKSEFEDIGLKGIDALGARTTVDSSTFLNCYRYGIYISGHHTPTYDSSLVKNSTITRTIGAIPDSSQYGILINGNDKTLIQGNHISYYRQGGFRIEAAKPKLQSDMVSSCTYYGAYLTQNSDPAFYGCRFDSLGGGIYAYNYSDPFIRSGCRFRNINNGNGIAVYAENYSNPYIRQTEFYNVTIGVKAKGYSLPNIGQTSGVRPDSGLCDFENCTNYYVYYVPSGRDTCLAQGNYYGLLGPNANKFSGLVRYLPYRQQDPFPKKAIFDDLPLSFSLNSNYPNPFNPQTTISFSLSDPAQTRVLIYNILGQKIKTLVNEYLSSGQYSYVWDGRNELGIEAASGVYLYRIESGSFIQAKKMIFPGFNGQ